MAKSAPAPQESLQESTATAKDEEKHKSLHISHHLAALACSPALVLVLSPSVGDFYLINYLRKKAISIYQVFTFFYFFSPFFLFPPFLSLLPFLFFFFFFLLFLYHQKYVRLRRAMHIFCSYLTRYKYNLQFNFVFS